MAILPPHPGTATIPYIGRALPRPLAGRDLPCPASLLFYLVARATLTCTTMPHAFLQRTALPLAALPCSALPRAALSRAALPRMPRTLHLLAHTASRNLLCRATPRTLPLALPYSALLLAVLPASARRCPALHVADLPARRCSYCHPRCSPAARDAMHCGPCCPFCYPCCSPAARTAARATRTVARAVPHLEPPSVDSYWDLEGSIHR
ncbi:unnamed protein product [Closterium sp. NIES-53]